MLNIIKICKYISFSIIFCTISVAQVQNTVPLGVFQGDEFIFTLNNYVYEHRNLGFDISKTYWELDGVNISSGTSFKVNVLNETPTIISGLGFYVIDIEIVNENTSSVILNHLSEFGFISHLNFELIGNDISSSYGNLGLNESYTYTIFDEPSYFGYETLYQDEINYRYGKATYNRINGVAINIEREIELNSLDSEEYIYLNITGNTDSKLNPHSPIFKISVVQVSVIITLIVGVKRKLQR